MIHLTKTVVKRWLDTLLHIDDTPERTALAYALGVFFGFSPFLGLHTVLAVACAFLFGLNRVAVLLGVYSNLPWIIGAWYTFTTIVGATITRTSLPPTLLSEFRQLFELSLTQGAFWHRLGTLMRPLAWAYVVGSTLGALALSAISYRVALAFVVARRRHRGTKATKA